jgi:hypothetical protein
MKITIELPDDLYRRAEAEAALRGCKLDNLVQEGLQRLIGNPRKAERQANLAELMKRACGIVSSDVPDLASNPTHLKNFGSKESDG